MSNTDLRLAGVKIARVSTVAFFVETQLKAQLKAIVDVGSELTVIASDDQLAFQFPGMRYVSVDIPRKIHPVRDLVALWRLWYLFRKEHFDIVHSTTPKAGLLCSVAAILAGVPIRLHTFTGQPWVGLSGVKRWLSKSSDWLIAKLNTYCYADSPSQRSFVVESGVASDTAIGVIGYGSLAGIDLHRFDPERFSDKERIALRYELGISDGAPVLLFVGRLTLDKGITELLAAYDELINRNVFATLVVLGPLEADCEAFLGALSVQARARVKLIGFSPEPERFMAISNFLVLPSYREGFGTVVLEAAAMGIPTIGTEIYGLIDAVEHGNTGLLVPVRDSHALAEAMETLLCNSEICKAMGKAAQRRAREHFASSHMSDLLISQYERWLDIFSANMGVKG
ncbi:MULTISPECIES: glycosyltransferase family 4 protein [Pseudomonadaceae]|uniref:glycosyltransferase family 4 protein n=1 Tax=Pseudomonadaceae TaxID=135621 RepID=UPI000AA4B336|nr:MULTISPECIES: glycosyltransferase family 4 protein [Pseudomonas]